MSKDQVEQPEIPERPVSAIAETLEKFLDSHVAAGHRIQMCLDREGKFFALFCTTCDPRMTDAFETRH
jgi:hypothetical protein